MNDDALSKHIEEQARLSDKDPAVGPEPHQRYPASQIRDELVNEALEVLAGLLYCTSPDEVTPQGRLYAAAKGLLVPILQCNEAEVMVHAEAMYHKHGTSLRLQGGDVQVLQYANGTGYYFLRDVDGDEVCLSRIDIEKLARHVGVIS